MSLKIIAPLAVAVCFASVAAFCADEPLKVDSPIKSISLFKNGLAVAHRVLNVEKPGRYLVDDRIEPLHGTLWTNADSKVSISGGLRSVGLPNVFPYASLQKSLLGREVSLKVADSSGKDFVVKGKVVDPSASDPRRDWARERVDFSERDSKWLTVKTDAGLVSLRESSIASISTDAFNQSVDAERPVLVFDVKAALSAPLDYMYLTKGVSWAPAYRLRLDDASAMTLSLSACVRNELEDLKDVDVNLISGYPHIAFSEVASPLCADVTWMDFFQQASRSFSGSSGRLPVMAQVMTNSAAGQYSCGDLASRCPISGQKGESSDIVLTPVGKMNLRRGESTWFEVASAKTSYERMVECVFLDRRSPSGELHDVKDEDSVAIWDAIRFKNPFAFPMTTAPAEITYGEKFLGQSVSSWANSNADAILKVTKALSVTASNSEAELNNMRTLVYVGAQSFMKTAVKGSVTMRNHRASSTRVLIKLQFSGDLMEAEGNPVSTLREEGVYSVNKRNQLIWEKDVKAGEQLVLNYSYSVLAPR